MNKLLIMVAAIAPLAMGSAMAGDLPVPYKAPIYKPACGNFGGFTFGGHGGWNAYRHDWKDLDNYGFNFTGQDHVGDGTNSRNSSHWGVQGGWNWQSGCTVYGITADWSWTSSNANAFYRDFPLAGAGTLNANSELKSFGTVRTRAGVVVDNLLIYVTGGVAFANFDRSYIHSIGPFSQSFADETTRTGFAIGAGTEWALAPSWSITSEFLYMGFRRDNVAFACSTGVTCLGLPVGTGFRYEFNDSIWAARLGVNYRFSGFGGY